MDSEIADRLDGQVDDFGDRSTKWMVYDQISVDNLAAKNAQITFLDVVILRTQLVEHGE